MPPIRETLLCRYHFDALNRLVATAPSAQATALRFYQKERLANEIRGPVQSSIMQHDDQLLAQQTRQGGTGAKTSLLATDPQRSVLNVMDATQSHRLIYTPYGYRPLSKGILSLPGFNGEQPDPVTGCYLLGTGHHRPFNPVLMRFICPDSWSPFGEGGLSAYAYCLGDPVNFSDRTGHSPRFFFRAGNLFASSKQVVKTGRITKSIPHETTMNNIRPLAKNVLSFDDMHKSKPRLNIMAHGTAETIDGRMTTMIESHPNNLSPNDLYGLAGNAGISFKHYDSIRLLTCYSANAGANSFAARFSALTNLPVKGFKGAVTYSPSPNPFFQALEENSSLFRHNGDGTFTFQGKLRIEKKQAVPGVTEKYNYLSATQRTIRS